MSAFKKYFKSSLLALGAVTILLVSSCKNDDNNDTPKPGYNVPATYNFSNVNYTGQTQRLGMMDELITYIKTANTGAQLDATKLQNMFANTNNPFANAAYNTGGRQLKNKVFSLVQSEFVKLLDSVAEASKSMNPGSNGVTGLVTSNDGTKKYLVNSKGMDYPEMVEKGLMGALIYYQITSVYLSDDQIGAGVDNTTVVAGEGTAMEHHWDEAFGYFGVPVDFPTNVTGVKYIAKYGNQRNALIGCNATIMNAYLKGRAAISNKDMATKDAQVIILRAELERVFVATAISYLNKAKAAMADDAIRNHTLSEAIGLVQGLYYNPSRKINEIGIAEFMNKLGDNLYEVTVADIDAARDHLSTIYGFDAIKTTL